MENLTKTLVINGLEPEAAEFKYWVEKNHPEIKIDFRENVTGAGAGLFNSDWNEIDGVGNQLWDEYCNS